MVGRIGFEDFSIQVEIEKTKNNYIKNFLIKYGCDFDKLKFYEKEQICLEKVIIEIELCKDEEGTCLLFYTFIGQDITAFKLFFNFIYKLIKITNAEFFILDSDKDIKYTHNDFETAHKEAKKSFLQNRLCLDLMFGKIRKRLSCGEGIQFILKTFPDHFYQATEPIEWYRFDKVDT